MSYANQASEVAAKGGLCYGRFSPPQRASAPVKPSRDISRLIEIMAALRTPGSGCPWDLEQTFRTIAPYTLEEAYEVADAIARGDLGGPQGRTGRSPAPGRLSRPHGRGTRRLRFRRRGRDRHRQAGAPPSARLCRCRGPHRQGRGRPVGTHQGGGKGRTRRGGAERCFGRGPGRPARVNPRPEAAEQGRPRRLRLERSARGPRQDPRGSRRNRGRA